MTSSHHPVDRAGVLAMFIAVTLFSVLAAAVAGAGVPAGAALCLTAAGSAVTMSLYAAARREPLRGMPVAPVARIGALALSQAGLYFAALQMAPVGPAAALHLAAPVLLLGWAVIRGQQTMDARTVLIAALLIAGLLLAAMSISGGNLTADLDPVAIAGLALALLSAALFACMITQVHRHAHRIPLVWSNTIRTAVSAVICAPLLFTAPPTTGGAALMILVGAVALGPGMILAWFALSRISPQITSTIDLGEAAMTPAIGHMVWGTALTVWHAAAVVPMLAAVYLQIRRPATPAGPDIKPAAEPTAAQPAAA